MALDGTEHASSPQPNSAAACAVLRIDNQAGEVSGIRCTASSSLFVERFVSTSFSHESEVSLAVAEVVAALGRPTSIGIISDFAGGQSGPAQGTLEAAERATKTSGHAVRMTATAETGDIVPAHEVDALIATIEGVGIAVARVETPHTARFRAVGNRKPRRRMSGCTIPNSLFEAQAATPNQLAPLVGSALALVGNDPAGDLRPSAAQTLSPAVEGSAGLGWSIQQTTAPVEFNLTVPTDPVELHYTLLAHALSMVALVLLVVLL